MSSTKKKGGKTNFFFLGFYDNGVILKYFRQSMNDIQEAMDRDFQDDGDGSPLLRLHRAIEFYFSSMPDLSSEPHYVIVSHSFLRYMKKFYGVETFTVQGHSVIGSENLGRNHAYVYPCFLYEQGLRPWD